MKNVLGRGLSSLVSSPAVPVRIPNSNVTLKEVVPAIQTALQESGTHLSTQDAQRVEYLPVADIAPGEFQPRQSFSESEIKELSDSIQNHGVLQPILVRKNRAGAISQYELIAGERRWRAAQRAGLLEIPALVKALSDQEALEIAIIENVQRHDLNPLEEARAYQRLLTEFSLTQEQVAQKVGKERATVANLLRLLKLSPEVQELVISKQLSAGHAKALLTIKESTAQISLARKAISEELTVRSLENVISRVVVLDTGTRKATLQIDRNQKEAETASVEVFPEVIERLRNALATKVQLKHKNNGSGSIEIQYHSETELDRLVEALCK